MSINNSGKLEMPLSWKIDTTADRAIADALKLKIDTKTKPLGSLGVLEDIAFKTGMIQNTLEPEIKKPVLIVFAADHGIADEPVSAFPKEVTAQMVLNFLNGGAAVNVFASLNGYDLKVVDAGVDFDFGNTEGLIDLKIGRGTKNMLHGPAMTAGQCIKAVQAGAELVRKEAEHGTNTIAFGEMGIGNTSSAALIMSKTLNIPVTKCTGRGTGINDEQLTKKTEILQKALEANGPYITTPWDILMRLGGFETAMMTGAMLQAAESEMLIIVDGFIVTSALLIAHGICPDILDYTVFAHLSDEYAHAEMLKYLNAEPLLKLNMRLGEGSGAAVALPIVKAALEFLNKMASFEDAAVSEKKDGV